MNESIHTSKRPWPRRLVWVLVILLLVAALPFGFYHYQRWNADRDLEDAIAELDRIDPGWRLEDVILNRRAVPNSENSALVSKAAFQALPKGWRSFLTNKFDEVPPPVRMGKDLEDQLRAGLAPLEKALIEARKLADLPRGRHGVVYTADYLSTRTDVADQIYDLTLLLQLDCRLHLQNGSSLEAWRSAGALLNLARSVGDEPLPVAQMSARGQAQMYAVISLERVLAQAEVTPVLLKDMQRNLADEANEDLSLYAYLGERGGNHRLMSLLEKVETSLGKSLNNFRAARASGKSTLWDSIRETFGMNKNMIKYSHAWLLRHYTEMIEASKLPGFERYLALERLEAKATPKIATLELAKALLSAKTAVAEQRADTRLHCAITALAAERFRMEHKRWPESLAELVKRDFLKELPIDLFDGQPLRFRRTNNGLAIYSIGPDKKYDRTDLDDLAKYKPRAMHIEFRLWNPEHRR